MRDLWPSSIKATTEGRAPITTLREQAVFLGKKTANIVEAKVRPAADPLAHENQFGYVFYLVAPALQDYHYRLFSIVHALEFYPLTIEVDGGIVKDLPEGLAYEVPDGAETPVSARVSVKDPPEFQKILAAIFGAEKTLRIIDAMLMQSAGAEAGVPGALGQS